MNLADSKSNSAELSAMWSALSEAFVSGDIRMRAAIVQDFIKCKACIAPEAFKNLRGVYVKLAGGKKKFNKLATIKL